MFIEMEAWNSDSSAYKDANTILICCPFDTTDIDMVQYFRTEVIHPHLDTDFIGRRGGLHDINMTRLRAPREQVDRIRVDWEL